MNSRSLKIIFIFAAFLIFISSTGLLADTDISIYYTASLNGNLIGCECHGNPKAGLSTTAVYLREIDHEGSILIDLGDFNDARTDRLLSETLADLYDSLGYDLVALGDQELGTGIEHLNSLRTKLQFICNNIKIDGKLLSPKPIIIERKGIKVGIAAVIDPDVFFFYPDDIKRRIEVSDSSSAAVEAYDFLDEAGADYKLLIFHGKLNKAEKIFAFQSGWDSVLSAHDQTLFELIDGKRIMVSPGEEGNRIGRLDLSFSGRELKASSNYLRYFKYKKGIEDPAIVGAFEEYKTELINNLKNGKE